MKKDRGRENWRQK